MPWFKVDDQLTFHEKVVLAGNTAMGVWVRAGAHCSAQLTDGRIPRDVAQIIAGKDRAGRDAIRALLEVGLWHEDGHGCPDCAPVSTGHYMMHDYLELNPSAHSTRQRRAEDAERKRLAREKRAEGRRMMTESLQTEHQASTRTPHGLPPDSTPSLPGILAESALPDPTRPDPTPTTEEPLAPAARKPRPPDPIWDALMGACGITSAEVTDSSRGGYNRAVGDLRKVNATPDEIHRRAENYRLHFDGAVLTPTALAKQWAKCAHPPSATVATLRPSRNAQLHADYLDRHREAQ